MEETALSLARTYLKSQWIFRRMLFIPTRENSIFFGLDGKVMVWRTSREEFDPKCTIPTIEHGGGLVMVWGCFTH